MPVTEIEIYEALKEKIGESSAKILIEFIDLKVEKEFERKKDILSTKQDIAELRSATMQEISELEAKIEKTKTDLIRWMFIFWVGQIGTLVAILALFFK
ncbi:MAG: DUF1640 domain-containing protein [Thermodesulfovibrio sp.]|uniref:DUF1640 domain-containing protein n=1 Tax=Thermodesulfovibrio sp. N1 TaxID=1871110 RepID=UPI00083B2390|nr:DUF1640 domain-containing protein [Thermodesulfovibrio sp. N1]MDI6713990.1 DUF1640 domain-containing protein [Thermodesulfovibrio sp.]ODA45001.1 Pyridoxamine 5'-phosphate oxidase [Thermodesulfovibrio sp. N1]